MAFFKAARDGEKRRWWRYLVAACGILFLLIVFAIGFLMLRPTRVDLGSFAAAIDQQLTAALGREVSIDGDIVLVTGFVPAILIEEVSIDNPSDWDHDEKFARLESFQTSIGLGELLERKINIDDVKVSGLTVSLERDADGRGNWEGLAPVTADEPAGVSETAAGGDGDADNGLDLTFTELGGITIESLDVSYRDHTLPESRHFHLDQLSGSARSGKPIALSISGTLLDLRLDGEFTGGTLDEFRGGASEWPLELTARLGDTAVRFDGHFSAADFTAPGQVNFEIDVPKPNQLVPLIGDLPDFGSLRLAGKAVRSAPFRYSASGLSGDLAGAEVTGDLQVDLSGSKPRIDGQLDVASLDIDVYRRPAAERKPEEPGGETDSPDSSPTDSTSADPSPNKRRLLPVIGKIQLRVDELIGAVTGLEVRDLNLELDLAEEESSADLSVQFGGAPLHGRLALSGQGDREIRFDLLLESADADLTTIIAYYAGNDRFSGTFQRLGYEIRGSGEDLRAAWHTRKVSLDVSGAKMVYRGDDEELHFTIESGSFDRVSGEPGECRLAGVIAETPFDLALGVASPDPSRRGLSRITQLDGRIAETEISLINQRQENPGPGGTRFAFSVKGDSLDQLDSIYELNLPPVGPYAASGVFAGSGGTREFSDVSIQVGNSHLSGLYRIERGEGRSHVTVDLKSRSLQLNDFIVDDWSPIHAEKAPAAAPGKAGEQAIKLDDLLSYEALHDQDASIKLDLAEVLSGRDRLGHCRLTAVIENGRLVVAPLSLGIPGGTFKGEFRFHPKANRTVDWSVQLAAEGFELGVLARRSDPDSDFSAIANAQLDLAARGVPYDAPHLNAATGSLDIDVCPRNIKAGALDIWATNLIFALLPKLDPKNESTVNCVIGRFRIEDGVMLATTLGMDTTTLRVLAEGQIDLVRETCDLVLTPHPKRPQLLSLELPLGVSGPLDAPEIAMGKLPVVRTVGRMAKNTLLFPLKLLAGERLPADGSDVCPCLEKPPPAATRER